MAIKLEHHFLNDTDLTKVQTTAAVTIPYDLTYVRTSPTAAVTWDTGGFYSDNTATIVEGDMFYLFGLRSSESLGAGVAGMIGTTYNAALSIGADAVMVYFVNNTFVGYQNGNFTSTESFSANQLYDFRFTFTAAKTFLDRRLSGVEAWTIWGDKAVDFTGQNCRAQANILGKTSTDFDLDRFVFTDSEGIPPDVVGGKRAGKRLIAMGQM